MKAETLISPIAIDLGGKYTGICMPHYYSGVVPDKADMRMTTLVMPEDGGKLTWSQAGRTATRHRIRSNKRRKLAKRLLKVALEAVLTRPLAAPEWNALSGLLNRRGYNRLEIELDLSSLEQAPSAFFAHLLPNYFTGAAPLLDQWENLLESIDKLRELQQEAAFQHSKRDAKKAFFTDTDIELDDATKKDSLTAYHLLQEAVTKTLDSLDYGHQHRREYLAKIRKEIDRDSRLADIRKEIPVDDLYQLLGNISNFQLRNLRWYFNDRAMAAGDSFDDQRLHSLTIRWLQGWHPQSEEEKQNRKQALAHLQKYQSGLEALRNLNPERTIPPYEDQNNRRPPKDQTLWLNPVTLSARYGDKWLIWAKNLLLNNSGWNEGIEENLQFFERKSRLQRNHLPAPDRHYAAAIFLQRILDRSRAFDPYALRLISREQQLSHDAQAHLDKLSRDLGSQYLQDFLQLGRDYYREVANARQGIWFQSGHSLLEKADINPPSKARIKHRLIGNILGCNLTEADLDDFLKNTWEARAQGRSTVRSICKSLEEIRKTHGNHFNHEIERLTYRISKDAALEKKLKGEEKEIWSAHKKALTAAGFIARQLQHTSEQVSRYANSFSMAQLYTILETDRHGFSKISLAAHNETAWRMQMIPDAEGKSSARCSRLAADSVRPFDGILRRLLERQAYEIAQLKIAQLQELDIHSGKIFIPLIAEENRFEFSMGLADIKKNRSKIKQLEKQLETQQGRWQDKTTRIKQAAGGICPYTGEIIGQRGEIDHIVPRSLSLEHNSTVFNSEANLIWASRRGNQDKLNQRKWLTDLHPKYLQQVFGTDNAQAIEQQITTKLAALPGRFIFTELAADQQNAVRHALFLPPDRPAYRKVFASLATQQATRVNGTQAWLVKRIIELLEQHFADSDLQLSFTAARVNVEQTSILRTLLSETDARYQKQDLQSVASHSLDALCAFVVATGNELHDELALGSVLLPTEGQTTNLLTELIADHIDIQRIERKPLFAKDQIASQALFKEGIYAEHFLPIWVSKDRISVGFDGYNAKSLVALEKCKDPTAFLELLRPLFTEQNLNLEQCLSSDRPVKLSIDRNRAFLHLQRVAKQACNDEDLLLANLLDGLSYTTANKECQGVIYDAAKKTYNTAEDILNDKGFSINLNFSNRQLGALKGKLTLPAKNDWQKLLQHPAIAPLLGTKADALDWRKLFEGHFAPGSSREHSKTRRVYSLPRIDGPSGGFRVRRQTPSGEPVWQLMATSGLASRGFRVADGSILWNQPMPIEQLDTKGLIEVGDRYYAATDGHIDFDHWLPIHCEHPGIAQVDMAPGTKDRRYIRITQPFTVFRDWLKSADAEVPGSYWEVRSEIKVDAKKFATAHAEPLLGSPRSNLFVQQLGEQISYWYIVESSSSAMKDAYQAAYLESQK